MRDIVRLTLGNGGHALIDADDAQRFCGHSWRRRSDGYVVRYDKKKHKWVRLHRLVINAADGESVDHINGDKSDNRKSNLRIATYRQNLCNRGKRSGFCTSKYKGVGFDPRTKKWRARIALNGKQTFLGHFTTEASAALAYNVAAEKLHGDFAKLNEVFS